MRITLQQLIDKGACAGQVRLFKRRYGGSVRVTKRECIAAAQLFDWDWAAQNLLSAPARRAWDEAIVTARRAWDEAIVTARRARGEAIVTARRAYHEATATAERAYHEATATAERAWDEATATVRRAYHEARAVAFYQAARGRP